MKRQPSTLGPQPRHRTGGPRPKAWKASPHNAVSGPTFVDATVNDESFKRGARLLTVATATFKRRPIAISGWSGRGVKTAPQWRCQIQRQTIHLADWADSEWLSSWWPSSSSQCRKQAGTRRQDGKRCATALRGAGHPGLCPRGAWILGPTAFDERMWRQHRKQSGGTRRPPAATKPTLDTPSEPQPGDRRSAQAGPGRVSTPKYME